MSPALALPLFVVSALATFGAAGVFADRLDHLGPRLGLPESAVGLLTAVAADTPEISSAVVALVEGKKHASLGIVVGSNVFNIAAMIGLSAVLAGTVTIGRRALMIEGTVGLLALLVAALLIAGALSAAVAMVLFVAIVGPYVVITLRTGRRPHDDAVPDEHHIEGRALAWSVALLVPAVALIVLGSFGMVTAALSLADRWNVSETVTGLLVLAVLTSLPNAFTAVRLGLSGRGDALVTETLASNTINLIGGVLIPALFVGVATATPSIAFDLLWLAGMTLVALVALALPRGLGRLGGAFLIALYVIFVTIHLVAG